MMKTKKKNRGFTLLECVLAIAVAVIVIEGLMTVQIHGLHVRRYAEISQANSIALGTEVHRLRALPLGKFYQADGTLNVPITEYRPLALAMPAGQTTNLYALIKISLSHENPSATKGPVKVTLTAEPVYKTSSGAWSKTMPNNMNLDSITETLEVIAL